MDVKQILISLKRSGSFPHASFPSAPPASVGVSLPVVPGDETMTPGPGMSQGGLVG